VAQKSGCLIYEKPRKKKERPAGMWFQGPMEGESSRKRTPYSVGGEGGTDWRFRSKKKGGKADNTPITWEKLDRKKGKIFVAEPEENRDRRVWGGKGAQVDR